MQKYIILCLYLSLTPSCLYAAGHEISVSAGGFDVNRSAKALGQVDVTFAPSWNGFMPRIGVFYTEQSAVYLYAGIAYPIVINKQWSLMPSLSFGRYHEAAERDLGYDMEFYSQLRLDYRLNSASKIGMGYGHISNGNFGDNNPGAETAYLSFSATW